MTLAESKLSVAAMYAIVGIAIVAPSGLKVLQSLVVGAEDIASEIREGIIGAYQAAAAAALAAQSIIAEKVRQLLNQARIIFRRTFGNNSSLPIKIVPMPKSFIPEVATHVEDAQTMFGKPMILTRVASHIAKVNRRSAVGTRGRAPSGRSWDEYPFASSAQGGALSSVRDVPSGENFLQGGIIAGAYLLEKINIGDSYFVIVTP